MAFPCLTRWRTTYARTPRSASPLGEITVAGTMAGSDTETALPEIARMCGLSYESFRKKFESMIGQPPGHYAGARRIEHAWRLLSVRDFTNQEMADLLGFYDEFHFSKAFRRFTGQTPRQFRLSQKSPLAKKGGGQPRRTAEERSRNRSLSGTRPFASIRG